MFGCRRLLDLDFTLVDSVVGKPLSQSSYFAVHCVCVFLCVLMKVPLMSVLKGELALVSKTI